MKSRNSRASQPQVFSERRNKDEISCLDLDALVSYIFIRNAIPPINVADCESKDN